MSIQHAQIAKSEKHLSKLIRTTDFGITTRKDRIVLALKGGWKLLIDSVPDETRERAIRAEIASMNRGGNWVPTGNEKHPLTIKYRSLQKELADGPKMDLYRLGTPRGTFYELTKTEWNYANTIATESNF